MTTTARTFDLTPHPRILPMLGEIVLPQWRCLAELIDNSVDGFLEAQRAGHPVPYPQVSINTPTTDAEGAMLSVRDNGPGMDADTLERAARAGWTSHDPINNLGLFGMGFNIATARLGLRTTIWTTRRGDSEWVGLQIDFECLSRQQAFIVPALTRPKQNPDSSGTEVTIERLKIQQREWLAKSTNRTIIMKHLGRTYSSMLGPACTPLRFALEVNGIQVRPRLHCVWGGPGNSERCVETARYGTVNAFQQFDVRLEQRPFCKQCWNWLGVGQLECPFCGVSDTVVQRERRIHGWLGIHRYLDSTDFGIDFLRNGRKILVADKEVFIWRDEAMDTEECEYPLDDPRHRGRIVGEVHLDHCRVPYTKDSFVREDAAWREMMEVLRGKGPLRPDIAQQLGFGENSSPLFKLFQAFRRSMPHNRRSGGYAKILVVPDNDRALAMVRRYDAGEAEYQSDQKWWELVEEAEAAALQPSHPGERGGETLGGDPLAQPPGPTTPTTDQPAPVPLSKPAPTRQPIASLSQLYADDLTGQRYQIQAFAVSANDPVLGKATVPWVIRRTAAGPWEFYVQTEHEVFKSVTMTPMDALLLQLAYLAVDFERGQGFPHTIAEVVSSFRSRYASSSRLDSDTLTGEATTQLVDIARNVVGRVAVEDARSFYEDLGPSRQESIRVSMASRGVANPQSAVDEGRFLQYAPPRIISDFVLSHPEMFFDGAYWDDAYSTLDYGSAAATDEARARVLSYYGGLLADAVWLAQRLTAEPDTASRERLMRASLATALLGRTSRPGINE